MHTEVEAIWKNNLKFKKVHFIILFSNFEKVGESIELLTKFGNLAKEGRPKIHSAPEKIIFSLKSIDMDIEMIRIY